MKTGTINVKLTLSLAELNEAISETAEGLKLLGRVILPNNRLKRLHIPKRRKPNTRILALGYYFEGGDEIDIED